MKERLLYLCQQFIAKESYVMNAENRRAALQQRLDQLRNETGEFIMYDQAAEMNEIAAELATFDEKLAGIAAERDLIASELLPLLQVYDGKKVYIQEETG